MAQEKACVAKIFLQLLDRASFMPPASYNLPTCLLKTCTQIYLFLPCASPEVGYLAIERYHNLCGGGESDVLSCALLSPFIERFANHLAQFQVETASPLTLEGLAVLCQTLAINA